MQFGHREAHPGDPVWRPARADGPWRRPIRGVSKEAFGASFLDYLEKADPNKRASNLRGFLEVMVLIVYVVDICTDLYFGLSNRNSKLLLVQVLSWVIIANMATQFIHGNIILLKRFYEHEMWTLFVLFHIPVIPAMAFDVLILIWHTLEPSEFFGVINVEQYWNSRKLFETLYESLP